MRLGATVLALALSSAGAPAGAGEAGVFDYYLLALSWSPSWCETTGDAREAEECEKGAGFGFVLHGLWPQHERGWPEWCRSAVRDPSRAETTAMRDVMGSADLARYQWQKHGRCSGLAPDAYFALAREAVASVALPQADSDGRTSAAEIEQAFLALNPALEPDGLVLTCREGLLAEVRVCLDRDLDPRDCGPDVLDRACGADGPIGQPPPR